MSRIGKNPIALPSGVTAEIGADAFSAKGKLGQLSVALSDDVEIAIEDNLVKVAPKNASKRSRAMWGTMRARIQNAVTGVAEGYTVNLEINGVGYRAAVEGKNLVLALGFSHPVNYPIPEGITMKCEKPTSIAIHGADKQKVGQIAAEIRAFRPPEPFKGKGVKYETETILRKEGKKK